jgi:hypothetical protein
MLDTDLHFRTFKTYSEYKMQLLIISKNYQQ